MIVSSFLVTTMILVAVISSTQKNIQSTIDSEGFKGGTRSVPIMPRPQSLGQQMLERWAKIGCENATVGKNGLIVGMMIWKP